MLALPLVDLTPPPLTLMPNAPSELIVGQPFLLTYHLTNHTSLLEETILVMEPAEAFVFGGNKILNRNLLPLSTECLTYHCVPMIPGRVKLPRLRVSRRGDTGDEKECLCGGDEKDVLEVFVRPRSGIGAS